MQCAQKSTSASSTSEAPIVGEMRGFFCSPYSWRRSTEMEPRCRTARAAYRAPTRHAGQPGRSDGKVCVRCHVPPPPPGPPRRVMPAGRPWELGAVPPFEQLHLAQAAYVGTLSKAVASGAVVAWAMRWSFGRGVLVGQRKRTERSSKRRAVEFMGVES